MFQIDGKDQKISIRDKEEIPLAWGGKLVYYNCIVGGSIDARFHAGHTERDHGEN